MIIQDKYKINIELINDNINNYYRINTPFYFNDGDHPVVILKRYINNNNNNNKYKYYLTDESNTLMRILNDTDDKIKQIEVLLNKLQFQINKDDGQIIFNIKDNNYIEQDIMNFVMTLLNIDKIFNKW